MSQSFAGQNLKYLRKLKGLTQEEFANKLNQKASVVHKMERGEFKPSLEMAKKLEGLLNITLIETADLSRALNSPNTFLETVCDYENPYNPLAKGIKVMSDGEVCLEGQDWVVKKKIRIKFI